MADENLLTDDFVRQLINVGEVDILVGLPTYNNAPTVGAILRSLQNGILRWFQRERAVIVNVDGGSRDGTPAMVGAVSIDDLRPLSLNALRTLHCITTRYSGGPSNGSAFRTILAAAELLRAKACVVISPESKNPQPEWLFRLLQPIFKDGFDLVTPTYRRHKFDGILITNLLYPMTRALYGLRIREPYANQFAFSGSFGSQFLSQNQGGQLWGDFSELSFTLAAIRQRARIGQTFLGSRQHVERRSSDLVPALRQTVGPLFSALESDFAAWSAISGSQPLYGTGPEASELLDPIRVNRKRLREMFITGVAELSSVFHAILAPSTLAQLQHIAAQSEPDFHYSAELWVKTIYEFAASYQKSVINRDHIVQALAPLFRGRAHTFLTENRNASAQEVENNIENLCLEFEGLKPYLLQIWKT